MHAQSTEKDAIHILPLRIVPLQTAGLRRARLVKNAKMQGMVELFSSSESGSGQIEPQALQQFFDFSRDQERDPEIVTRLSQLPSYDVYSLRQEFRKLGITVTNRRDLSLSRDKSRDLLSHMNAFVEPLLAHIYGNGQYENNSYEGLVKMFMSPDIGKARQNLQELARSLEIKLTDLPVFFERYSDVYLSLAYYASILRQIEDPVDSLIDTIDRLMRNEEFGQSGSLCRTCTHLKERLSSTTINLAYLLDSYKTQTRSMWNNISPERYRRMEKLIQNYQQVAGANLCALVVKSNAWQDLKDKHNLKTCAHFIMSDMIAGMRHMPSIEALLITEPPEPIKDLDGDAEDAGGDDDGAWEI